MTYFPSSATELDQLSDLEVLQLAKIVLESDAKLLQHGFKMETPDGLCHCVVGAVREACGAYAIGTLDQDPAWARVGKIVGDVFAPLIDVDALVEAYTAQANHINSEMVSRWRNGTDPDGCVYSYNDYVLYDQTAPDRGKARAIAFINQAIEKLQAEGATA